MVFNIFGIRKELQFLIHLKEFVPDMCMCNKKGKYTDFKKMLQF